MLKLSVFICRPGFLPDPNDGSLYVLGGKHKEGLMVSVVGRTVSQRRVRICVIYVTPLLYRNSHLLFQSWCSRLHAGVQMECSTPVTTNTCFIVGCWKQFQSFYLLYYVHSQVKSRTPGLWWTLRRVKNRRVWAPHPRILYAHQRLSCTLVAQVHTP